MNREVESGKIVGEEIESQREGELSNSRSGSYLMNIRGHDGPRSGIL